MTARVEGAALQFNKDRTSAQLEFAGITAEEGAKLGKAVTCVIEGLLPDAIRAYVDIDGVQFLGGAAFVDATIRNLLLLSEVRLKRLSLTDPRIALVDRAPRRPRCRGFCVSGNGRANSDRQVAVGR
ncbi:hypothetical protein [Breoghania sp.]|uniref:hypothetical protein n=1 Tax=Breoghania sp. TaxID=2065378 RepID=UPI00260BA7E0|nr:hypothetical protein [Breoghania sp.]MDJ0933364.1 hypothetical protein [Breoghania sp.]